MPPQAVPEFQAALAALAARAGVDVAALLDRISVLSPVEARAFITDAYPALIDPFLSAAGELTTQWYAEQPVTPVAAGQSVFEPEPAPMIDKDRLAASARWALTQLDAMPALRGSATRAVFDQSRTTVMVNVGRENVRWARHASADACGFCRMLATRTTEADGLYRSKRSATRVVTSRGSRKLGDRYHDHCGCLAVPVRDGVYEPPAYVEQWQQDYEAAHAKYGSDAAAISRAMDPRAPAPNRSGAKSGKNATGATRLPADPADPLPGVRRLPGPFDPVADLTAVNPGWDGKDGNCTRCAVALELRHQGYDVKALALGAAADNTPAGVLGKFLSPDGSPAGQGGSGLIQLDTKFARPGETLGMSTGSRIWHWLPTGNRKAQRAADAAVMEWGEGSRGFVIVKWNEGWSHIFNVENRGGKVVYTDGQSNEVDAVGHWAHVSREKFAARIVRVDDLTPRAEVMDWVRERTDDDIELAANKARMLARLAAQRQPGGLLGGPEGWWPDIPHVNTPEYRGANRDGVARSKVYRDSDGNAEPLPDLTHMPGHVLYGWRDDDKSPHRVGDRRGHRWDSTRVPATVFPRRWTEQADQKIVDAVRDTIESPTHYMPARDEARAVRREIDGVLIEAQWSVINGTVVPGSLRAYPVRGIEVKETREKSKPGPVKNPHRDDKKFREVGS